MVKLEKYVIDYLYAGGELFTTHITKLIMFYVVENVEPFSKMPDTKEEEALLH